MTNDKWNCFMMTGKISDYLDYKKSENLSAKVGDTLGNDNAQGNSAQRVSSGRKR